jgi:hypothetical protein
MSAHGACRTTLEHDCKQTPKDCPYQNSLKWKNVQGQMEWFEFGLQKMIKLSQRNMPSHVVMGDDS